VDGIPRVFDPQAEEKTPSRERMLEAARKTYAAIEKKEAIVQFTPEFAALKIAWSKRVREAEIAVAKNRDERFAAANGHLQRMSETLKRFMERRNHIDETTIQVPMLKQAVAEAQVVLDQESKEGQK
jgi:hypothetical protein